MNSIDKRNEVIQLLNACQDIADSKEFPIKVGQLLEYMRVNFTPAELNEDDIKSCARLWSRDFVLDENSIRDFPDSVYPVTVIRLALLRDKFPNTVASMKEFDWFHKTYGHCILEATKSRRLA